jgi:hypothetical protein
VVPLQAAVEKGLAPSITGTLQAGQAIPKAIAAVPGIAAQVGNSIANAADPAALIAKATPKRASFEPLPIMSGGSGSGNGIEGIGVGWELISDSGLLFTIGVLIIGGGVLTYLRSATDAAVRKSDDKPPKV